MEAGEFGGLARNKSFFQKTLEAARGALLVGLGGEWRGGGLPWQRGEAGGQGSGKCASATRRGDNGTPLWIGGPGG